MKRGALGVLIDERCAELGIQSQAELRRLLGAKACDVSANSLSMWVTGARCPRPGRLAALLDVLQVHGEARDRWYRSAAEGGASEADDDPASLASRPHPPSF